MGIFFAFNVTAGSIRKADKDMVTPLLVNGFINILNVILNWFLIYPDKIVSFSVMEINIRRGNLGVMGAAYATAIATMTGGILMLFFNEKHKDTAMIAKADIKDNFLRAEGKEIIGKYILVGIPAFLTSVVTSLGRVIFTAMVVPLGTEIYAAHSIAFTAESAFYIPAVGMASAVASLSGNVRGEGNLKKLNRQTNMVCVIIVFIMMIATGILLICADGIISFFTNDAGALILAPKLLRIVAINEPMFGISIVMQYVFNGIGKTKIPLVVSGFTQWFVRVLGVFIFVHVLGFGIEIAWICMISDNILRAILLYGWYWADNKRILA